MKTKKCLVFTYKNCMLFLSLCDRHKTKYCFLRFIYLQEVCSDDYMKWRSDMEYGYYMVLTRSYCRVYVWLQTGFRLVNEFIDHFQVALQTTITPSLFPHFYSSLLHTLMSSVYFNLHCRFLATDFNTRTITVSLNYTPQTSHIKSFLHGLPYRTDSQLTLSLYITSRYGPRRKHSSSTVEVQLLHY
jgi:hypothetical protein